jgi:hypothetical protein
MQVFSTSYDLRILDAVALISRPFFNHQSQSILDILDSRVAGQ